jgi:hypothetical protein
MFSVDNFYLILQQNLLKPLEIASWYFYPFGTWNLQLLNYYYNYDPKKLKVIFWDQEPFNINLYADVLHKKEQDKPMQNKPNTVAISDICSDSKIVPYNWYYFYHGFAALDWYRDAQYVPLNNKFSKVFITLNRLTRQERSYRLALVADLLNRNLAEHGLISSLHQEWRQEIVDQKTKLTSSQINLITEVFSKYPSNLYIDSQCTPGWSSASLGQNEFVLFQSAFLHLVTETVFYPNKLHLTEKIFRPIAVGRPFVLAGAQGNLKYLKKYGFETFNKWWDESYDNQANHHIRLHKIINIIEKLSTEDLQDMYYDMRFVLEHNHKHFYNDFKKIIFKEMIDNFITVVETFNSNNPKSAHNLSKINLNFVQHYLK